MPPEQPQDSFAGPHVGGPAGELVGRRVRLRPIRSRDRDQLEDLFLSDDALWWRTSGRPLAPSGFDAFLWQGIFVQFAIESKSDARFLGLQSSYRADPVNRIAFVATFLKPGAAVPGLALESTVLFVDYLFHNFGLRKVFFEMPGTAVESIRSMGFADSVLATEGRLRNHVNIRGSLEDLHYLSTTPKQWFDSNQRLRKRF